MQKKRDQAYSDWLICLILFCISTALCLAKTMHSVEVCAGEEREGGWKDCSYYNLVQKKTYCLQIPNYLNRTISEFYYTSYTFSTNFTKVD